MERKLHEQQEKEKIQEKEKYKKLGYMKKEELKLMMFIKLV